MRRFGVLWFGIGLMLIATIGAFTPLHLQLVQAIYGNIPDEIYPEAFYLFICIPTSLIVILIGTILAAFYKKRS